MLKLRGRGAILVGTKRVGGVVAHRLAREGVNLAIVYRSSRREAERLNSEVAGLTERTALIGGDLSDEGDVARIVQEASDGLGDLSFVVNLAAGFPRNPFETLDGTAWDAAMSFAKGNYLLNVHAARVMMGNEGPTRGHIVQFSDWAAWETPYKDYLPYLTAKAAIDFMTRSFAVELADAGILVNAIAPGPTMRPPEISESSWQRDVLDKTPLRRESSAEDMAEIIVSLLSSESITGQVIRVDSGRHLAGPGVD